MQAAVQAPKFYIHQCKFNKPFWTMSARPKRHVPCQCCVDLIIVSGRPRLGSKRSSSLMLTNMRHTHCLWQGPRQDSTTNMAKRPAAAMEAAVPVGAAVLPAAAVRRSSSFAPAEPEMEAGVRLNVQNSCCFAFPFVCRLHSYAVSPWPRTTKALRTQRRCWKSSVNGLLMKPVLMRPVDAPRSLQRTSKQERGPMKAMTATCPRKKENQKHTLPTLMASHACTASSRPAEVGSTYSGLGAPGSARGSSWSRR